MKKKNSILLISLFIGLLGIKYAQVEAQYVKEVQHFENKEERSNTETEKSVMCDFFDSTSITDCSCKMDCDSCLSNSGCGWCPTGFLYTTTFEDGAFINQDFNLSLGFCFPVEDFPAQFIFNSNTATTNTTGWKLYCYDFLHSRQCLYDDFSLVLRFYLFLMISSCGGGLVGCVAYFVYRRVKPKRLLRPEDIPLTDMDESRP